MFGNKKTDDSQNKQLEALQKQVNGLVTAFNATVKNSDAWGIYLNKKLPQLEAQIQQLTTYMTEKSKIDQAQDEKINSFLANLANLTKQSTTEPQST